MSDLRDLVELEGQKQVAGCDTSSSSCLGDLAGALGADLVLGTRAGKLDAVYVVSLQLYDARSTGNEGRTSVEAWSLAEASTKVGPAIDELLRKATGTAPSESSVAPLSKKEAPAIAIGDDFPEVVPDFVQQRRRHEVFQLVFVGGADLDVLAEQRDA